MNNDPSSSARKIGRAGLNAPAEAICRTEINARCGIVIRQHQTPSIKSRDVLREQEFAAEVDYSLLVVRSKCIWSGSACSLDKKSLWSFEDECHLHPSPRHRKPQRPSHRLFGRHLPPQPLNDLCQSLP